MKRQFNEHQCCDQSKRQKIIENSVNDSNITVRKRYLNEYSCLDQSKRQKMIENSANNDHVTTLLVEKLAQKNSIILQLEKELYEHKLIIKKFMHTHGRCTLENICGI